MGRSLTTMQFGRALTRWTGRATKLALFGLLLAVFVNVFAFNTPNVSAAAKEECKYDKVTVGQITPGQLIPSAECALGKLGEVKNNFGTVQSSIASIFNIIILASTGIFIVIMVIGGITYLSSAGNEEGTTKAKKMLLDAIIGLMITLISWGAGYWILDTTFHKNLSGTTASGGQTAGGGGEDDVNQPQFKQVVYGMYETNGTQISNQNNYPYAAYYPESDAGNVVYLDNYNGSLNLKFNEKYYFKYTTRDVLCSNSPVIINNSLSSIKITVSTSIATIVSCIVEVNKIISGSSTTNGTSITNNTASNNAATTTTGVINTSIESTYPIDGSFIFTYSNGDTEFRSTASFENYVDTYCAGGKNTIYTSQKSTLPSNVADAMGYTSNSALYGWYCTPDLTKDRFTKDPVDGRVINGRQDYPTQVWFTTLKKRQLPASTAKQKPNQTFVLMQYSNGAITLGNYLSLEPKQFQVIGSDLNTFNRNRNPFQTSLGVSSLPYGAVLQLGYQYGLTLDELRKPARNALVNPVLTSNYKSSDNQPRLVWYYRTDGTYTDLEAANAATANGAVQNTSGGGIINAVGGVLTNLWHGIVGLF